MKIFTHKTLVETLDIIKRPAQQANEDKVAAVVNILHAVKNQGDEALQFYTKTFDGVEVKNIVLTTNEIEQMATLIDADLKKAIDIAYKNINAFHQPQFKNEEAIKTMDGITCYRRMVAIEKVGLYIPGGSAPLFSTLLMLGIPAQIVGCKQIVLCTPPNKTGGIHPAIAYCASICGINTIYLCGGAQAVAAMAYGTATIPKVYKIFGPGNQYVTIAKQLIQAQGVAIDMPAGPSEVLVIADENANAKFVAADLLAQAEHGPDSQVICITTSQNKGEEIKAEVTAQLQFLSRKEVTEKALDNSFIIIADSVMSAMKISNAYAPEHLILQTNDVELVANDVKNAGSVFMGAYTPESVGDYASGTNHVLPTSAYANAYSGVSVDSFVKKITFQTLSEIGIKNIGQAVITMAQAEGLDAHANAVIKRLENL